MSRGFDRVECQIFFARNFIVRTWNVLDMADILICLQDVHDLYKTCQSQSGQVNLYYYIDLQLTKVGTKVKGKIFRGFVLYQNKHLYRMFAWVYLTTSTLVFRYFCYYSQAKLMNVTNRYVKI